MNKAMREHILSQLTVTSKIFAIVTEIRQIDKEIAKDISILQRSRANKAVARQQRRIEDSKHWRQSKVDEIAKLQGGRAAPKFWPEPANEVGLYSCHVNYQGELVELISVKSLMGPICWESPGTPYTCSVQSETYWSS